MKTAAKQPPILPMLIVGIGTLGAWVKIGQLSLRFNIGEGHLSRPIPTVVAMLLIASALYIVGYVLVRRWPSAKWYTAFIIAVGLLSRLVLMPSHMIQESDAYRYIWDGQVQHAGINPYRYSPGYIREAWDYKRTVNAPQEVEHLIESIRGQKGTRTILNWVSYPKYVTIYPPLAQMVFYVATAITPWDLMGMRLVFLAFDLATWLLVGWTLRKASSARYHSGLLLYGWSPLVLKEVINALHYESLTALLLTATTLLLVFRRPEGRKPSVRHGSVSPADGEPTQPSGTRLTESWHTRKATVFRLLASSAALGLAIAAKLYPLILLPLVGAVQYRRHVLLPLCGLLVTAAVTVGLYAIYYAPDVQLYGSLDHFVTEWERNATIHPLTVKLIENVGTEHFQDWVPQRFQQRTASVAASAFLGAIFVAVLGVLAYRLMRKRVQREAFLSFTIVAVVLAFCLSPMQNPWYLVGVVPLLALQRRPFLSVILLTGLLSLRYMNFYLIYHCEDLRADECRRQLLMIRLVEFVPFYLAAMAEIVYRLRRKVSRFVRVAS